MESKTLLTYTLDAIVHQDELFDDWDEVDLTRDLIYQQADEIGLAHYLPQLKMFLDELLNHPTINPLCNPNDGKTGYLYHRVNDGIITMYEYTWTPNDLIHFMHSLDANLTVHN